MLREMLERAQATWAGMNRPPASNQKKDEQR